MATILLSAVPPIINDYSAAVVTIPSMGKAALIACKAIQGATPCSVVTATMSSTAVQALTL